MSEVEITEEEVGFVVHVFAAAVADEEGAGFDIVGLELVFCFVEDHRDGGNKPLGGHPLAQFKLKPYSIFFS